MPTPLTPGQRLRSSIRDYEYEIVRVLGQGGMGTVVAAEASDGYMYALKVVRPEFADNENSQSMFEREARIWMSFPSHPHVVSLEALDRIRSFREHDGSLCLVLEYLGGGSLGDLLAKKPLEIPRALHLALELCDAMAHIHEARGVVHRDIKPANCLLDQYGRIKLTDFGIAKVRHHGLATPSGHAQSDHDLTDPWGSRPWMAPEQRQRNVLDARADIYSFGVMLHQMLTRKIPKSPEFDARKTLGTRASSPLPTSLFDLIHASVAPERAERPSSFLELRMAIAREYEERCAAPAFARRVSASPDVRELNRRASAHLALGENLEAVDLLDQILVVDPLNVPALSNKGVACRRIGRHLDAIHCARRAVEIDRNVATVGCLAQALEVAGAQEDALTTYGQALALQPDNATVLYNYGGLLVAMGFIAQGKENLNRALALACPGLTLAQHLRDAIGTDEEDVAPPDEQATVDVPPSADSSVTATLDDLDPIRSRSRRGMARLNLRARFRRTID